MSDQREFRPRIKPIDLALALALGGATLTAGLVAYKRLGPTIRNEPATGDSAEGQDPPLFYSVIGRSATSPTGSGDTGGREQYTIELGEARTQEEATRRINDLQRRGVEAFFTPLNRSGHVIYRIRNGVYDSTEAATAMRDRLTKAGHSATVTRL